MHLVKMGLTNSWLQVTKVNSEQLQQEITARTCPLVIDFYATWCGPCLLLAKELEKVPLVVTRVLISRQHQRTAPRCICSCR